MKSVLLSLLFLIQLTIVQAYDIDQIRTRYISAVENSDKADQLYSQLSSIKNPDALILAYLGSAQALKAKHAWNPVNKLSYLKKGFVSIDQAVEKSPNNLEVRFLRFSLAYYVPSFLGYSKSLEGDKDKIIELLSKKPHIQLDGNQKVLKNIVKFMLESKMCNAQQLAILHKVNV